MGSQVWVVSTLLISIVLIVLTIVKLKFHPFLALLLASFFVGAMMGMGPLEMVNAIESGIGGTLGFLAAVIGLGTILGKMMEVSGAAERGLMNLKGHKATGGIRASLYNAMPMEGVDALARYMREFEKEHI